MEPSQTVHCTCGSTELILVGDPFLVAECMCDSCRTAGAILQSLPGAPPVLDEKGATLAVMYRKDRVNCSKGAEQLKEFRLKPDSKTRRVIAGCCNSAMILEFTSGHWIDIYGMRWPAENRPRPQMRTMVGDLPEGRKMPDDIPNLKTHDLRFYGKLMAAWAAMGFRVPTVDYVTGVADVQR